MLIYDCSADGAARHTVFIHSVSRVKGKADAAVVVLGNNSKEPLYY